MKMSAIAMLLMSADAAANGSLAEPDRRLCRHVNRTMPWPRAEHREIKKANMKTAADATAYRAIHGVDGNGLMLLRWHLIFFGITRASLLPCRQQRQNPWLPAGGVFVARREKSDRHRGLALIMLMTRRRLMA